MTTLSDSFALSIYEKDNNFKESLVDYNDLKIGDIKFLIWDNKKEMLKINDSNTLKLWKVTFNINLKDIITKE